MTFFMFKGLAAKLFLSTQMVTTLIFPAPVEKVIAGWNKEDVYKYQSKDKKVLVLRASNKSVLSNMTIITKSAVYDFNVTINEKNPHKGAIEIKNGRPSTSFAEVKNTPMFKILEGESTVLVVPKKMITLNGKMISSQSVLPRGIPLFINSKRVMY